MQCTADGKADHILAARFLSRFVPEGTPGSTWICPPPSAAAAWRHINTDITGFGVRYTLELLRGGKLPLPSGKPRDDDFDPAPARRLASAPARRRGHGRGAALHARRASAAPSSCRISSHRSRPPRWRWPTASGSCAALPAGCDVRAPDDAVPDRPHRARGGRARHGQRLHRRIQALSGRRHHPLGVRCHGYPQHRRVLETHERARHACCRCTARSPTREVDVFDREARFIDEVLLPLVRAPSAAAHRFRTHHDARAPWNSCAGARAGVAATITPQHLLMNRNALFAGGIRPHHYCLPVLEDRDGSRGAGRGRDQRRSALLPRHRQRAARARAKESGLRLRRHLQRARRASSCTRKSSKRRARCRSCRASPRSSARIFIGLPRNADCITLVRQAWKVPAQLSLRRGRAGAVARGRDRSRWRLAARRARVCIAVSAPSSESVAAGGRGGAHVPSLPRLSARGDRCGDRRLSRRAPMRCWRSPRCSSTWTPSGTLARGATHSYHVQPFPGARLDPAVVQRHRHRSLSSVAPGAARARSACSASSAKCATQCAPTTAGARSWSATTRPSIWAS